MRNRIEDCLRAGLQCSRLSDLEMPEHQVGPQT